MKSLAISVAGSGQVHDVQIEAGTTAQEVMMSLNLEGYHLTKIGGHPFGPGENIYPLVEDGEKLQCTTSTPVGEAGPLIAGLLALATLIFIVRNYHAHKHSKVVLVSTNGQPRGRAGVRHTRRAVPHGRRTTLVQRMQQPHWKERGWQQRGSKLVGYYRTPQGSFEGSIGISRSLPQFYIHNPPPQLKKSSHWSCFHHRGGSRYWIHFTTKPQNPDAGIITVERLLSDALRRN